MRCLVIDDSASDRELVERMLAKNGYRATCVASGTDALEEVSQQSFDVALVDLGMPGMTGHELLRELRVRAPAMRLLVVSGFDDSANMLSALDAGADGYVLKDELLESLGAALQAVIAGQASLSTRVTAALLKHVRGKLGIDPPEPRKPGKLADASGELIIANVQLVRK